ncbi:hypothetical protein ABMA28_002959 [Loxostege sticticalis]|uniref:HAT C-terminal dimerisation domain-containing protein n=1 Tax=Loxostege sticticalis TaxID=481309 RepID=A0ABD0SYK8_LOXSC
MPPTVKKRTCKFTEDLQKEFPFLQKCLTPSEVRCNKCNGTFSVAHGGKYDIQRHLTSEKHKKSLTAASSSSSLTTYFRHEKYGDKEAELAKAEGLWAFHTVCHSHSFRSMDCTSKLIQKVFDKKFSCGKTKCEAIATNVIEPYSADVLKTELNDVPFICIYTDASNHKDIKIFPTLVRYFHPTTGINVKILDLVNLPGETAEMIYVSLMETLEKHNLKDKVIGFCADNANTNFGGVERSGQCNVFRKLQEGLGRQIVGVGCAAHIAHNAIQTAADLLPVDVEHIVTKIYSYFYIYTVRVENLKEFCEEAEMQYKKMLGYSKTRWLALSSSVERILQMYAPLKSYFLSQEKCPAALHNFFSNECSELWLKFVHVQASIFTDSVKMMEGDKTSITEVSHFLVDLKNKYSNRLEHEYIPLTIRNELTNLVESGNINRDYFMGHIRNFYKNCIQYLEKYMHQYDEFKTSTWIQLKQSLKWNDVQLTYQQLLVQIPSLATTLIEDNLFDEVNYVSNYVNSDILKGWEENKYSTEKRWLEVFENFKKTGIPIKNCLLIVQYLLCLPGTNAPTERVFSLMNALWTSEKSSLKVETLRALLVLKFNMGSCEEFYDILNKNPELVKKCHSSDKYDFKNK